ncbi:MAG TPA: matrixin family metalloprotease [Caldilineaceae bacterium]|nr:matrixin family metalloprotease [Caldilineaceae bacterium]
MPRKKLSYLLLLVLISALPSVAIAKILPSQGDSHLSPQFSAVQVGGDDASFSALFKNSTTVAIGQATGAHSQWNAQHSLIETEYRFQLIDLLIDQPRPTHLAPLSSGSEIAVITEGGFLPQEDLGLWVAHEPTFQQGEVVLLLLNPIDRATAKVVSSGDVVQSDGSVSVFPQYFQLVGGELGKYTISDGFVTNEPLDMHTPLTPFLQQIDSYLATAQRTSTTLVQTLRVITENTQPVPDDSIVFDGPMGSDDEPPRWLNSSLELAVKVNINSAQINGETKSAADFFMAIQHAMRTWSVIRSADFTLLYDGETNTTQTGYNGENEIVFMHRGANKPLGQAQIWYTAGNVILEVDMWLNDDYQFSVSDTPILGEVDLESVVLHELGHWVPLSHSSNPDAVMYSVLSTMEVKRDLHADDINAVVQLYPCDLLPCINDIYLVDLATPTPRPLVTPTPTPTQTSTPTLVPTAATPTLVPTQLPTGLDLIYLPYITR